MEERKEGKVSVFIKSYGWQLYDLLLIIVGNPLSIRVVLKFLGASPSNPLVGSFYLLTDVLARPVLELFPRLVVSSEQSIFEGSTILLFFLVYVLHQGFWCGKSYKKG